MKIFEAMESHRFQSHFVKKNSYFQLRPYTAEVVNYSFRREQLGDFWVIVRPLALHTWIIQMGADRHFLNIFNPLLIPNQVMISNSISFLKNLSFGIALGWISTHSTYTILKLSTTIIKQKIIGYRLFSFEILIIRFYEVNRYSQSTVANISEWKWKGEGKYE